jgi:hypothetical protein
MRSTIFKKCWNTRVLQVCCSHPGKEINNFFPGFYYYSVMKTRKEIAIYCPPCEGFTFMDSLHPSQLLLISESQRVIRKASGCIFGAAMALYCSTVLPSHWLTKLSSMAIASMLSGISIRLDKLDGKYLSPYAAIGLQQSTVGYQQFVGQSMKPSASMATAAIAPIEVTTGETVQYSDVRQALSKPHILVLGETGSGKSTLVKFLVSHAIAPALVLDSHAAPDDWQTLNVIGMGRDYEAIGKEVERLVALMDARYEARKLGQKKFEPLIVILDEFPACVANLGKGFTEAIMLLVREARKIGIRLIVLSQGAEVKALGIEGQGSIRECFAIVSLGKFATDRAKSLKDEQIKAAIAAAQYPAMLEDLPCQLPTIDSVNLNVLPMPSDYLELTTVDKLTGIDELTSIDSPVDAQKALKPHVNLSKPLEAILDFAKKQDCFVTASQVKAGIRLFRDTPVSEIRSYFQWLADHGHGVVRGETDSLEFSAN